MGKRSQAIHGSNDYRLFIAGSFVESGDGARFESRNPYDGQVWASIPQATDADVDAAIAAARYAFDTVWSKTSPERRAKCMFRLAELIESNAANLARIETTDNGKLIRETLPQMMFSARLFRFFAGYTDKLWGKTIPMESRQMFDYTTRNPMGVVALITAWNSPLVLLANKLPAALAAGNCVVIKPSEHASASTLEFCRLVEEAGFPAGVINVVTGDARVGRALTTSKRIDKISFTGSPEVGREIAVSAGRNLIPVSLELGGKSPNIVFEDADLDRVVTGALAGIFGATGQSCIAGSRLLVQKSIYSRLVEQLADRAGAIILGDPLNERTEMGPVANEPQFIRVLARVAAAKQDGARLVIGGARASGSGLDRGYFISPTIFADVANAMPLAQEEIFGPVLAVIPFSDEEEAIAIANDTNFGLASGVWTRDLARSLRTSEAIRAGTVWINTYRASACNTPVGGLKDSGFGRERGEEGLLDFTVTKNVMIDFSDQHRDPFAIRT